MSIKRKPWVRSLQGRLFGSTPKGAHPANQEVRSLAYERTIRTQLPWRHRLHRYAWQAMAKTNACDMSFTFASETYQKFGGLHYPAYPETSCLRAYTYNAYHAYMHIRIMRAYMHAYRHACRQAHMHWYDAIWTASWPHHHHDVDCQHWLLCACVLEDRSSGWQCCSTL